MAQPLNNTIELLSVDLLEQQRPLVNELRQMSKSLNLEFGWHYLLDLAWIISLVGPVDGKHIIDAGAGVGMMQWYLARHGAQVTSVDRSSREMLPTGYRKQFNAKGFRPSDLAPISRLLSYDLNDRPTWKSRFSTFSRDVMGIFKRSDGHGQVLIYNQDLTSLQDIADQTIDMVVAVSSLEHNSPENLPVVVKELMRVLKPGGALLATLTAARDHDRWHEPSKGWCYTDESLRQLFELPTGTNSNYDRYNDLFVRVAEL